MVRRGLWRVLCALAILVSSCAQAEEPQAIEPLLSAKTRLMVFSPHPDDETLGAGGLVQRVLGMGGQVKVVFMTNGDGFPEGVEKEDHIAYPTAKDYREYGKKRREESLQALTVLGMKEQDVTFLGFPDGGLCYLLWKYRSDPKAYRSPYTKENHPSESEMIIPHTDYNGRDLRKEIARVIADFRPDLLALTPPEDEHPDHCATYHLVREALINLEKQGSFTQPKVLTFLIHFGQWPVGQGSGTGSRLNPPENPPDKETTWISFPLQPEEAHLKRKALLQYHTQMLVMGRYLMSFARANELFFMEHQGMTREMGKMPRCCR
jgi:LmbE family N-acetylglucosaminyl deacetylase